MVGLGSRKVSLMSGLCGQIGGHGGVNGNHHCDYWRTFSLGSTVTSGTVYRRSVGCCAIEDSFVLRGRLLGRGKIFSEG